MHRRRSRYICSLVGHRECHCGSCKRCGAHLGLVSAVHEAIKRAYETMARKPLEPAR
jgi:hypothetical protein